MGLIRPPERWTDPNTVSYRSWEADSVIVAGPKIPFARQPAIGTRCYVHGATVVQVVSRSQGDVLMVINGRADRLDGTDVNSGKYDGYIIDISVEGEQREVDHCPDGTMFIVSLDEAQKMIWNERMRMERWERDKILLHGLAEDAAHLVDEF
jgi:hypothetical protein